MMPRLIQVEAVAKVARAPVINVDEGEIVAPREI